MIPALNLGCGCRVLTTYGGMEFVNVDKEPDTQRFADMYGAKLLMHDMYQPLPFANSTFGFVNLSQVLEHFNLVYALVLLRECWRVLKPLGKIRVSVPDARLLVDAYQRGDMAKFAAVQPPLYNDMRSQMTKLGLILFGALHKDGMDGHKQCYDADGLMEVMTMAGFVKLELVTYDKVLDAEMAENHQLVVVGMKPLC